MAKTQLIRKSFNAGELSPELHYRDDLAAYVKGCKNLTNMIPTPYGAVTRRPPFEVLSRIDTNRYGIPVRYIPFKFSLTEIFHIIFTDGSGVASEDRTTADLIIFDKDGAQVVFDGVPSPVLSALPLVLDGTSQGPSTLNTGFVAMANTIYDPADLQEMHFINVNDFVLLTCGGKYPVQAINRFFDKDEQGNRWKIDEWEVNGGPFLDPNINLNDKLSTVTPVYSASAAYAESTILFGEGISKEFANSTRFERNKVPKSLPSNVYGLRVAVIGHGTQTGDSFQANLSLYGGVNCTFYGTTEQANNVDLSGEYQNYRRYTSDVFWANIYVKLGDGGTLPTATLGGSKFWKSEDYGGFYTCIQNAPVGTPLTDVTYWEPTERFDGSLVINSDSGVFSPTDVGRQVRMKVENNNDGTHGEYVANQTSPSIVATSSVVMKTEGGSWSGTLQLQESTDDGANWETIGEITSVDGASNGSIDRDISDPNSLVRVKLIEYVVAATGDKKKCIWTLSTSGTAYEVFRVAVYISPNQVYANTLTPIYAPRSEGSWALGAFSDTSGYPFSLTIHDERLCLGGCLLKPNTVYASKVNEWDNFFEGSLETSPYTFTIASDSFDTIRSLKSARQLNVMTDNAENTMGSRDDNAVTSVTNISVSSHTNYGSNETQAIQMADMIWFVMGQGERVRASKYDFASDGQQSVEMSLFASHITKSGVKEMSFRRHPFNSLFCLLNNGTGAVLTYEGMQEVKAWATVKTEGNIISAASNYSDTGDIIAGIIERDGSYFLEQFGSVDADTVFLDNQTNWVDANFDVGQDVLQGSGQNLIVTLDDTELVRDVDYSIVSQIDPVQDVDLPLDSGFLLQGDFYYDLTGQYWSSEQLVDLELYVDGVLTPFDSNYRISTSALIIDASTYSPTSTYSLAVFTNVPKDSHESGGFGAVYVLRNYGFSLSQTSTIVSRTDGEGWDQILDGVFKSQNDERFFSSSGEWKFDPFDPTWDNTTTFDVRYTPKVQPSVGEALGLGNLYEYNLNNYGLSNNMLQYLQIFVDGVLTDKSEDYVLDTSKGFLRFQVSQGVYSATAQYTIRFVAADAPATLIIPSVITGNVCIGRRIECRVNPTDISEVAPSGMVKRLTELGMYLLDSGTCNVEINGKPSPFTDGLKWVAGQRESGLFELTTGGDYEQGLDVNITIDGHRHFTLTGLGYRLGISQG